VAEKQELKNKNKNNPAPSTSPATTNWVRLPVGGWQKTTESIQVKTLKQ
jgi:hypothetical protein